MSDLNDFFNSDKWKEFSKAMQEAQEMYEEEAQQFWDSLSYQDKLRAFYAVSKRIHKGDVEDKGSYRYVLYEIFGFEMESYGIGMDCGYMDIHNSIRTSDEIESIVRRILSESQLDCSSVDWEKFRTYFR